MGLGKWGVNRMTTFEPRCSRRGQLKKFRLADSVILLVATGVSAVVSMAAAFVPPGIIPMTIALAFCVAYVAVPRTRFVVLAVLAGLVGTVGFLVFLLEPFGPGLSWWIAMPTPLVLFLLSVGLLGPLSRRFESACALLDA